MGEYLCDGIRKKDFCILETSKDTYNPHRSPSMRKWLDNELEEGFTQHSGKLKQNEQRSRRTI